VTRGIEQVNGDVTCPKIEMGIGGATVLGKPRIVEDRESGEEGLSQYIFKGSLTELARVLFNNKA